METAAAVQAQDPRGDHSCPTESPESPSGKEKVDVEQRQKRKKNLKRPLKPLSQRRVKDYNDGLAKRGVVYLSRVPPFMKPAKVKHLMEQHGVVTRVSEWVVVVWGLLYLYNPVHRLLPVQQQYTWYHRDFQQYCCRQQ